MYRDNALKQRLAAGKKALGSWLASDSAINAELLSLAGYDLVIIDHEHGPGSLMDAVRQIQAMGANGPTIVMRVPWNEPVYIKRALDTGIEGVLIPMVETADEARVAVSACRYPPRGQRGSATRIVRAADYGLSHRRYADTAHENLVIMCQVESVKGVDNIAAIGAVEGVDALFIGPADLSSSIGKMGRYEDAEVMALLHRTETAIKATGKYLASVPFGPYGWETLFERGYHIAMAASDVGFIRDGAVAQVMAHRAKNG